MSLICGGQVMVFQQQKEVWDYYKSMERQVYRDWAIRGLLGIPILTSLAIFLLRGFDPKSVVWAVVLTIALSGLMTYVLGRCLVKKYPLEYDTYGMKYLPYVLFLGKLADQKYTREDIAKLRRAVEIAEIPTQPAFQFNEHPLIWVLVIVPLATGLWNLSADFVKQADIWRGNQETVAAFSAFGVKIALSPEKSQDAKSTLTRLSVLAVGVIFLCLLIEFFLFWRGFRMGIWSRKAKYQEIQRFLQWAEHDIEEEQFHRRQYLCKKIPGPHEPSH
jgi:hypothetical protein